MERIKIVISDFHLGVGRTFEGGVINSLEEFYFDEKFAEFLNYYVTGEYSEHEIELIINGDFLNLISVDYRGHFLSVITESVTLEKVRRIVEGHQRVFQALRDFAKKENHKITYVVGNHDMGILWPAVRLYLNEVLDTSIRYKNIVYYFEGVHIEHGHMYEAANRIDPKRFFLKKNVAEPILNLPFGSHFFVNFVLKVKEDYSQVDKVRPMKALVRWGLFQDTFFTLKTLGKLIVFFFKSVFSLETKFRWSWRQMLNLLSKGNVFPDLTTAARKVLEDERVNTVIFGHSHVYRYRQFGKNKEYFNTGTWTEATSLDISSFGKNTKLTYVLVEYPKDAEGHPRCRLKEWRGYHRIEEDVDIS